jgi:hypothetical protein
VLSQLLCGELSPVYRKAVSCRPYFRKPLKTFACKTWFIDYHWVSNLFIGVLSQVMFSRKYSHPGQWMNSDNVSNNMQFGKRLALQGLRLDTYANFHIVFLSFWWPGLTIYKILVCGPLLGNMLIFIPSRKMQGVLIGSL